VRDIPFNILEESISMIERTALKLLPIMKELGTRLAGSNGKKGIQGFHTVVDGSVDTRNLSQ
jgi:ribosome-associated protein YbcJ (S4-like RNA binding protein)